MTSMAQQSLTSNFSRIPEIYAPPYPPPYPTIAQTCEDNKTSDQEHLHSQTDAVTTWTRTKRIGRGAFGTVWLECNDKNGLRAVKEVAKESSGTPLRVDYKRELEALRWLSNVSSLPERELLKSQSFLVSRLFCSFPRMV